MSDKIQTPNQSNSPANPMEANMSKALTELDYKEAADSIGVEVAIIKAFKEVESSKGTGFLPDGKVLILYEPYTFNARTKNKFVNKTINLNGIEYPLALAGLWDRNKCKYGAVSIQHAKLEAAKKLDEKAALESCSWGLFQVMGFNYMSSGFKNVFEFVNFLSVNEKNQLLAAINYLKQNNLVRHLKAPVNFAALARGYNGAGYAQNRYDEKLKAAYQKYKL